MFDANVVDSLMLGCIPEVVIFNGADEWNTAELEPETCDPYIKADADFGIGAEG